MAQKSFISKERTAVCELTKVVRVVRELISSAGISVSWAFISLFCIFRALIAKQSRNELRPWCPPVQSSRISLLQRLAA